MTVIKICGITNVDDALSAVRAGADLIGFIFHSKSPRFVPPGRVTEIVQSLRKQPVPVTTVGVFVNEEPQLIIRTLSQTGLDLAQLSGDEPLEQLHALVGCAYKAIRSVETANSILQTWKSGNSHAPDLLLDASHPTLYGGSGLRADANLALTLSRRCRLLLAGGLNPDNVAAAIQHVQPWGVDVASGVEASPGKKDLAKILAFVRAVRQQDLLQVR
jgi:phosphoribosylanthranilate isomerase